MLSCGEALTLCSLMQGLLETAKEAMDCVEKACAQVQTCQRLHAVLRVVLTVGNTLNHGTSRGSADGLQLESLPKLADMKVSSPSPKAAPCIPVHQGRTLHPRPPRPHLAQPSFKATPCILVHQGFTLHPHLPRLRLASDCIAVETELLRASSHLVAALLR